MTFYLVDKKGKELAFFNALASAKKEAAKIKGCHIEIRMTEDELITELVSAFEDGNEDGSCGINSVDNYNEYLHKVW